MVELREILGLSSQDDGPVGTDVVNQDSRIPEAVLGLRQSHRTDQHGPLVAFGAAPPGGPADARIGAAPMRNAPAPSWPEWYAADRLLPYLRTDGDGRRYLDSLAGYSPGASFVSHL